MRTEVQLSSLRLPVRPWRFMVVGMLMLLVALLGGHIVALSGSSPAELAPVVALSTIRVPALDDVALIIHYSFEPLVDFALLATLCLLLLWPCGPCGRWRSDLSRPSGG
jgi:hypothetical protein